MVKADRGIFILSDLPDLPLSQMPDLPDLPLSFLPDLPDLPPDLPLSFC